MCVACGAYDPCVPIFVNEVQFVSHTRFTFYLCQPCAIYSEHGPHGGADPRSKAFDLLPPEEKKRAFLANRCVSVSVPFFYLGKMEFWFINDTYGRLFWKLNGGEMNEQHTELPEFK
jgi:hypothetical protein